MDMSEIIEFVMPVKCEYTDQTNDGGVGGGGEDDDSVSNNQYVVLDAVDVGREYKSEEYFLVNDDGDDEGELLIKNEQFHQQLIGCPELLDQTTMRLPKQELDELDGELEEEEEEEQQLEEEVQYMMDEPHSVDLDDLVEEAIDDDDDGEQEETEDNEMAEEEEEHYEQYVNNLVQQDHDQQQEQEQQLYSWNYLQTATEMESVAIELDASKKYNNNAKTKATMQSLKRNYVMPDDEDDANDDDVYEEIENDATMEQQSAGQIQISEEPPVPLAQPSEKMLDMFKGPRRYMLFDELIATIVDFDEDGTPIVEFSMIGSLQDEKLPVECGICPDVMHKSKLSKHQKTHLVPGKNRYACIYCTETYRDCKYLAGHARRHMGIRPYVCEPCKLYFSTKQDLRVHNQRRHLEKEHICEMCGKTFAQNTQLKRHREATHEKKRRFQCEYCQKAYYKNFSLQEHIRNVHMGKRRMLKCPFCGMQCRDAHKMARHRKEMHLNQDTYVCHLCQEEFTDINYFDAHKRSIQCRSNTRRLVNEDESRINNEDGIFITEGDELADMLEEDFDEDAGLLIESNYVNGVIDNDVDEEQLQQQQEQEQQQHLQPTSCEEATIYETVNSNYLHDDAELEEQQQQQQQQYEQNNYEDGLLIEHIAEDDNEQHTEEQLLDDNDDEHYLETQLEQQQHADYHQHHHQHTQHRQQEYNDHELIYEITLETEDN
ncbi:zinc finger protein 287 [Drosophila innubila]|uniref:zinc finger protein 287 n=1 Tax=Drosophila innubila TaxID=198719 RepID=UPI00148B5A25|nr:zinc finger protein 287 [Drosophila innubila]